MLNLPTNKAFLAAMLKGYQAGKDGLPKKSNPYPDKTRDYRNGPTFSRTFRRYWNEGWEAGYKELLDAVNLVWGIKGCSRRSHDGEEGSETGEGVKRGKGQAEAAGGQKPAPL
ncbi:MAG: hypothetical protein WCR92_06405 [Candidatus Cloacimonadaceae bacterium]